MSCRSANRFVPSLESLGERLNPGVLAGAGALPDATSHEFVFGVELPAAGGEVRVSTFPAVGRGSPGSDGVVILYSSLPGAAADAPREQPRPTIILQRLANPSLPDDSTAEAEAGRNVRFRTFAIVDRTQLSEDVRGGEAGKIVLWAEVDENGERIGPFFQFKANRLRAIDVGADEVILIGANRTESRDPDGGSENGGITFHLDAEPRGELQGTLFIAKQWALREGDTETTLIELGAPVRHEGTSGQIDRPGRFTWAYLIRRVSSTPGDLIGDAGPARGGYSGTHALYQDVFIPAGAGSASGDIVLKGSKIGENAPIDVDNVTASGESEALRRRTQVTILSADLDRPGTSP